MTRWLDEPLGDGLLRRWRLDEVLWEGDTPYQHVLIARTAHGVTLFCDGERQSAELSQLVYHEALLVPALLLADRVRRVLVVGSSEGVVSQLAVAAGADAVDHVDIDRECVRACARYLPYGYGVAELAAAERAESARCAVHYADGWDHVASTALRYDIVVVDLPDERPVVAAAQHNRLYDVDFLRRCRDVLADGGVLAFQAGCPTLWRNATLASSVARFSEAFATVGYYGSDEHEWAFLFGLAGPAVADPTALMVDRLAACRYRPRTLDAAALRAGSVPPHSIRLAGR
ncbi:MAG TPA: spermidine synthase [Pseudonocardiaceae bacterium]|jgi:spermidine synthase